jgi:hypothetical protein
MTVGDIKHDCGEMPFHPRSGLQLNLKRFRELSKVIGLRSGCGVPLGGHIDELRSTWCRPATVVTLNHCPDHLPKKGSNVDRQNLNSH